jgi:hypothetical protein
VRGCSRSLTDVGVGRVRNCQHVARCCTVTMCLRGRDCLCWHRQVYSDRHMMAAVCYRGCALPCYCWNRQQKAGVQHERTSLQLYSSKVQWQHMLALKVVVCACPACCFCKLVAADSSRRASPGLGKRVHLILLCCFAPTPAACPCLHQCGAAACDQIVLQMPATGHRLS